VNPRVEELLQIVSDLMDECLKQKEFEKLFDIAVGSRLLFRALGAEEANRSTLLAVESAAILLIGKDHPVTPSETEPACSFCGKKRPEVMLGAGPDAFICHECVDLFTEVFRLDREKKALDEAPK